MKHYQPGHLKWPSYGDVRGARPLACLCLKTITSLVSKHAHLLCLNGPKHYLPTAINGGSAAFSVDINELESNENTIPDRQPFEADIQLAGSWLNGIRTKLSTTPMRKAIPPGDVPMEA